jgi:hypothetical protein
MDTDGNKPTIDGPPPSNWRPLTEADRPWSIRSGRVGRRRGTGRAGECGRRRFVVLLLFSDPERQKKSKETDAHVNSG